MKTLSTDRFRREILDLLEETFVHHHGIYTDRGTSLMETLDALDHHAASRRIPRQDETIAGHVFHTRFYMVVLVEYITGKRTGKTDWNESWIVKEVDEAQWAVLRRSLKDEYSALTRFIQEWDDWDGEDSLGGILGILAHCAYHLGAIRQLKDF